MNYDQHLSNMSLARGKPPSDAGVTAIANSLAYASVPSQLHPHFPPRIKTQWDYVLAEMKWLATDFIEERKWKSAAVRTVSQSIRSNGHFYNPIGTGAGDSEAGGSKILPGEFVDAPRNHSLDNECGKLGAGIPALTDSIQKQENEAAKITNEMGVNQLSQNATSDVGKGEMLGLEDPTPSDMESSKAIAAQLSGMFSTWWWRDSTINKEAVKSGGAVPNNGEESQKEEQNDVRLEGNAMDFTMGSLFHEEKIPRFGMDRHKNDKHFDHISQPAPKRRKIQGPNVISVDAGAESKSDSLSSTILKETSHKQIVASIISAMNVASSRTAALKMPRKERRSHKVTPPKRNRNNDGLDKTEKADDASDADMSVCSMKSCRLRLRGCGRYLTKSQIHAIAFIESQLKLDQREHEDEVGFGGAALLGGQFGSGKTVSTGALFWLRKTEGPQLLLCRSSSVIRWVQELGKFNDLNVSSFGMHGGFRRESHVRSTMSRLPSGRVVVCDFLALRALSRMLVSMNGYNGKRAHDEIAILRMGLSQFATLIVDARSLERNEPNSDRNDSCSHFGTSMEFWNDFLRAIPPSKTTKRVMIDACNDLKGTCCCNLTLGEVAKDQWIDFLACKVVFINEPGLFFSKRLPPNRRCISWAKKIKDWKLNSDVGEVRSKTQSTSPDALSVLVDAIRPFSSCCFHAGGEGEDSGDINGNLSRLLVEQLPEPNWEIRIRSMPPFQRDAYDQCCSFVRGTLSSSGFGARSDAEYSLINDDEKALSHGFLGSRFLFKRPADAFLRLRKACFFSQLYGSPWASGRLLPRVSKGDEFENNLARRGGSPSQPNIDTALFILERSTKMRELLSILQIECGFSFIEDDRISAQVNSSCSNEMAKELSSRPLEKKKVLILAALPEAQYLTSLFCNSLGLAHEALILPSSKLRNSGVKILGKKREEFNLSKEVFDGDQKDVSEAAGAWMIIQQALANFDSDVDSTESPNGEIYHARPCNIVITSPRILSSTLGGLGASAASVVVSLDEDWSEAGNEDIASIAAKARLRHLATAQNETAQLNSECKLIKVISRDTCEHYFACADMPGGSEEKKSTNDSHKEGGIAGKETYPSNKTDAHGTWDGITHSIRESVLENIDQPLDIILQPKSALRRDVFRNSAMRFLGGLKKWTFLFEKITKDSQNSSLNGGKKAAELFLSMIIQLENEGATGRMISLLSRSVVEVCATPSGIWNLASSIPDSDTVLSPCWRYAERLRCPGELFHTSPANSHASNFFPQPLPSAKPGFVDANPSTTPGKVDIDLADAWRKSGLGRTRDDFALSLLTYPVEPEKNDETTLPNRETPSKEKGNFELAGGTKVADTKEISNRKRKGLSEEGVGQKEDQNSFFQRPRKRRCMNTSSSWFCLSKKPGLQFSRDGNQGVEAIAYFPPLVPGILITARRSVSDIDARIGGLNDMSLKAPVLGSTVKEGALDVASTPNKDFTPFDVNVSSIMPSPVSPAPLSSLETPTFEDISLADPSTLLGGTKIYSADQSKVLEEVSETINDDDAFFDVFDFSEPVATDTLPIKPTIEESETAEMSDPIRGVDGDYGMLGSGALPSMDLSAELAAGSLFDVYHQTPSQTRNCLGAAILFVGRFDEVIRKSFDDINSSKIRLASAESITHGIVSNGLSFTSSIGAVPEIEVTAGAKLNAVGGEKRLIANKRNNVSKKMKKNSQQSMGSSSHSSNSKNEHRPRNQVYAEHGRSSIACTSIQVTHMYQSAARVRSRLARTVSKPVMSSSPGSRGNKTALSFLQSMLETNAVDSSDISDFVVCLAVEVREGITGDLSKATSLSQRSLFSSSLDGPQQVNFGPFHAGHLVSQEGMFGVPVPKDKVGFSLPMGVNFPLGSGAAQDEKKTDWGDCQIATLQKSASNFFHNWQLASRQVSCVRPDRENTFHFSSSNNLHYNARSASQCRKLWESLSKDDPQLAKDAQRSTRYKFGRKPADVPRSIGAAIGSLSRDKEFNSSSSFYLSLIKEKQYMGWANQEEAEDASSQNLPIQSTQRLNSLKSAAKKLHRIPVTIPGCKEETRNSSLPFVPPHPSHGQSVQQAIRDASEASGIMPSRAEMWPLQLVDLAEKQRAATRPPQQRLPHEGNERNHPSTPGGVKAEQKPSTPRVNEPNPVFRSDQDPTHPSLQEQPTYGTGKAEDTPSAAIPASALNPLPNTTNVPTPTATGAQQHTIAPISGEFVPSSREATAVQGSHSIPHTSQVPLTGSTPIHAPSSTFGSQNLLIAGVSGNAHRIQGEVRYGTESSDNRRS